MTRDVTWCWGEVPDLSGMQQFVVMIRAPGDPERLPRDGRDMGAEWRRKLMKQPVGEIADALRQHLQDGQPRTLNRIGVELIDKTADLTGGTPFETALWSLVELGEVEFTMQAPVLFRKASPVARADAPAAPAATEPPAAPPAPAAKARKPRRPPEPPAAPEEPPAAPAARRKLSLGRLRSQ